MVICLVPKKVPQDLGDRARLDSVRGRILGVRRGRRQGAQVDRDRSGDSVGVPCVNGSVGPPEVEVILGVENRDE